MNRTKVEYQELRKALKKYDEKVMDKYDDLSINFKGCMTEELCYNDIKSYFNERKETVLVINGLFLQNREGNKNEGSEKDFIIVNYTLRFRSSHFLFLVFGHFWQPSNENTKILHNLCLHFARQDGQDGKNGKKITQLK